MSSLMDTPLESNMNHKINFNGGDMSSDAGLLLLKEFINKLAIDRLIKKLFKTNDSAASRLHKDFENLLQVIYQFIAAYFQDDNADELRNDPVFTEIIGKESLASQPTLSRFFNRMGKDTLAQFNEIARRLRGIVYSITKPEMVLLDLDSMLLETYGEQEGEEFNYHYYANGYHPLVCYDGLTRDLLKVQLRNGSDYCSTGVVEFLQPLLEEYSADYPGIKLFLRGDSGFATPGLYTQCEKNGVSYAIRLKNNTVLQRLSRNLADELTEKTKTNMVDYAVVYGEFYYQAGSWDYPRRVACKIEKHKGQLFPVSMFIVTNMDLEPEQIIRYYCNRGRMENFIKEGKLGFDFTAVSSSTEVVNANRLQIHALAYNIFNLFRRLVLPEDMRNYLIDTVRIKLLKIAARVIRSARYVTFKLCSSCPYKEEFYKTLDNIRRLRPQLV